MAFKKQQGIQPKQQSKQQGKQYTESFHIYGIRKTRNPKYYSLSIVRGSDENREFANIVLKADNVRQDQNGNYYIGYIKLLEPKKEEKDEEVSGDNMPF